MDHPLILHKISMLRSKETGTKDFRELICEIALLIGYEATRDLPVSEYTVSTPVFGPNASFFEVDDDPPGGYRTS